MKTDTIAVNNKYPHPEIHSQAETITTDNLLLLDFKLL